MKSIERRLITTLVLGSLLILGMGGALLYFSARTVLYRRFDADLKTRAQAMMALTTQEQTGIVFEIPKEMTKNYRRREKGDYYQLWLADGRILARSPSLADTSLSPAAVDMGSSEYWDLVLPNGEKGRAIGVQFIPESEEQNPTRSARELGAPVTLVVAGSVVGISHRLIAFRNHLMIIGVVMLAATVLMVRIVIRRGLDPLAEMADRASWIEAASLGQRFSTERMPIELLPICERLNDLLARLEASFIRERRFTADAAHELRTPIAELRSLAEVSLKWPDDSEATALAFQDALQIARKMETVISHLLALARCEEGRQMIVPAEVPVLEIVEETWRSFAEHGKQRQLRLISAVPPGLNLRTDRALFAVILANLFSNAVEYTPIGGAVYVRADRHDAFFRMTVSNDVENLTAEDLPYIFERFWRKDPARTSSKHTGLGLALSKSFAELMGFSLSAELAASTITFTLYGTVKDPVQPQQTLQSA